MADHKSHKSLNPVPILLVLVIKTLDFITTYFGLKNPNLLLIYEMNPLGFTLLSMAVGFIWCVSATILPQIPSLFEPKVRKLGSYCSFGVALLFLYPIINNLTVII